MTTETPIYSQAKTWSTDGIQVFPDRIVIEQRGAGPVTLRKDQLTEVRPAGAWSFDKRGYRLHLRVGSKKYVIRHLTKEEADQIAALLS